MASERVVGDLGALRGYDDVLRLPTKTAKVHSAPVVVADSDFEAEVVFLYRFQDSGFSGIIYNGTQSNGWFAGMDTSGKFVVVSYHNGFSQPITSSATATIGSVYRMVLSRIGTTYRLRVYDGEALLVDQSGGSRPLIAGNIEFGLGSMVSSLGSYSDIISARQNDVVQYTLNGQFGNVQVLDSSGNGNNGTINGAQWWKKGIDDQYATALLAKNDLIAEGSFVEDVTLLVTDRAQYIPTEDPFWDDVRALQGAYTFEVVDKFSSGSIVGGIVSAIRRRR